MTVVPSPGVTPALVGVVGEDMDFSATRTNPPWEFTLTVPAGIKLGTHMITAVGRGEADLMQSPPVHVDIERREAPLKIIPSLTVLILEVGDEIALELTGTFRDGARSELSESTRTFYKSDDRTVATVTGMNVKAVSVGSTRIIATYMSRSVVVPVKVTAPRAPLPSTMAPPAR